MSRVEPEPQKRSNEPREQSPDRKPSKAEGDEQTVEEALQNQEHNRRADL